MKKLLMTALVASTCSLIPQSFTATAEAEVACAVPIDGVLTILNLPEFSDVIECDAVDRLIDLDGLQMPIPPPGYSVSRILDTDQGDATTTVSTSLLGIVEYFTEDHRVEEPRPQVPESQEEDGTVGSAQYPEMALLPDPQPSCENTTHEEYDYKLRAAWSFYIGDGIMPAGGTRDQLKNAAIAAGNTWESENSPCYGSDGSAIPGMNYGGMTSVEGDFHTANGKTGCVPKSEIDSRSSIDAGNLDSDGPGTPIAATCVWVSPYSGRDKVVQADIRFNTTNNDFTYNPDDPNCSGKYDVLSIMTHEFGHVVGLVDLLFGNDGYETMYAYGSKCTKWARTLGKGDVLGARTIY